MNLKSDLRLSLPGIKCKLAEEITKGRLETLDEEISSLCSDRNTQIVKEYIQNFQNSDGRFAQVGMWKLKNKLIPKEMDPPMAKKDKKGNLISASG